MFASFNNLIHLSIEHLRLEHLTFAYNLCKISFLRDSLVESLEIKAEKQFDEFVFLATFLIKFQK